MDLRGIRDFERFQVELKGSNGTGWCSEYHTVASLFAEMKKV